jgi:hypothetical protein
MEPLKLVKHALSSTINQIKTGDHPTVALEKVAIALDLNPHFIQRTGEALNVALTHNHFKKSASDRANDFDIADPQHVTSKIFGTQEKTLHQKKAEWFPTVNETVDYNKYLIDEEFQKTASTISNTSANFDSYETSFKGQYKKASEYISRVERELDDIKTEKVATDVYVESAFMNLVNGFKKHASARTPFHEFESQVYSLHGEPVKEYIDLIYKTAGISEERGSHDPKYIAFTPSSETALFSSFLKAASQRNEFEVQVKEAEEFVSEQKQELHQAGYKLNPMAQAFEKLSCETMDDELDGLVQVLEKVADAKSNIIQTLFSKFREVSSGGSKNGSPHHTNSSIDNRARITLLQDLIMTDPILMKQDPRKIIQAYQQILRLSPQLSKEKEVVRAQLRAMMAGQALHPTDAEQLVGIDSALMKQHRMQHETSENKEKDDK